MHDRHQLESAILALCDEAGVTPRAVFQFGVTLTGGRSLDSLSADECRYYRRQLASWTPRDVRRWLFGRARTADMRPGAVARVIDVRD